eukprot:12002682-Heterocapsa_arctica.AAC.1
MEVQACSGAGILGGKCAPYLGRGQLPKLRWTLILEKVDLPQDWGDSDVHWWAQLSARLKEAVVLKLHEPCKQLSNIFIWLAGLTVPIKCE